MSKAMQDKRAAAVAVAFALVACADFSIGDIECLGDGDCSDGFVCVDRECVPVDGADVDTEDGAIDAAEGDAETDTRRDIAQDVHPDAGAATANGCGGFDALRHGDALVAVGDACGCGGVYVCSGTNAVVCVGEAPRNVCGGCGVADGAAGRACGDCSDGLLRCDEGQMVCDGASAANICGGCAVLSRAPGAPCDGAMPGSVWGCDGEDAVQCLGAGDQNPCGGIGPMELDG